METTTHTRIRIGDIGGLITWVVGLCAILLGVAAASSGDGLLPGFFMLGTLAMFISLCWSLASMASAVTLLGREPERAMTALLLNATPGAARPSSLARRGPCTPRDGLRPASCRKNVTLDTIARVE